MDAITATMPSFAASPSRALNIASWIARIVAAAILLQTLFFKFSGAPESVFIFETVGMEPLGRYGSGAVELIASILFFFPRTTALGGLLAMGVMAGAIVSHLTVLGIVVLDDGGTLFALALVVFACSALVTWVHRRTLPVIGPRLP